MTTHQWLKTLTFLFAALAVVVILLGLLLKNNIVEFSLSFSHELVHLFLSLERYECGAFELACFPVSHHVD